MAASDNFGTSALLGFQGRMAKGLTQWETRELDTMALYYALENTQFFEEIYDVKTVKQSVQRPLYAYAFNRITTANGSGMTSFPTGGQGTSAQISLAFVSLTQNFSTYNVNGLDNVMDFDAIFANAATQAMRQIRTGLREYITNFLYTSRTTYGIPTLTGANFNAATDSFEIAGNQPYSVMTSIMRQNSYNDSEYDVFMDSQLYQNYLFSNAQGVGNATNLAYQFSPTTVAPGVGQFGNIWEDINLGTTVEIPEGYTTGYCLMMPRRSFAFVPWMPALYYDPSVNKDVNSMAAFNSYEGGYGTIGDNKYRNLQYMLFGWKTQSDTAAANGYAQSQTQQWQIGVNFAMVTAYLSNAGETPIYGMALLGG